MTEQDETLQEVEKTQNTENTTEAEKVNILNFELSDGTKCEMKRAKALTIIRARKQSSDEEMFYAHYIAATTTFDGQKKTANDIVNLYADDYVLLEYHSKMLCAPKNLLTQGM